MTIFIHSTWGKIYKNLCKKNYTSVKKISNKGD